VEERRLGRTGRSVGVIGQGAWQLGGDWGEVGEDDALEVLDAAVDAGVTFIDTADVYGDGRSEQLVGRLLQRRPDAGLTVATKMGRRVEQTPANYSRANFLDWNDRSRRNLGVETLDLVQLHCPPTDVYYRPEVFGILDDLVKAGKVRYYGVSVEKVEEALKAIEFPGVQSVQIIFNLFRQRPADHFFAEAKRRQVGILARLPLSSGMLTGKLRKESSFATDDHRAYNRHGERFDRGETFSGVDYDLSLELVDALRPLVPSGQSLSQFALRWVTMFDAVTCAIPGARRRAQVEENAAAADLPPHPAATLATLQALYDSRVRSLVHQYW